MAKGYKIFPRGKKFRDNWPRVFEEKEAEHKICEVCGETKEVYAVTESCIYARKFICNDCCKKKCIWYDHEEGCKRLGRWE